MKTINFPEVLGRVANLPEVTFQCESDNVRDLIEVVCNQHTTLRDHLFYGNGEMKSHFLLSIDGVIGRVDDELAEGSTVDILLAASGGLELVEDADVEEYKSSDGLSSEEVSRYARHITLPNVGRRGQMKLKQAKVLLIGTGGLGAPVSMYLAAAGVGSLGLMDFDVVEASNLQRQIVHGNSTLGKLKVDSAKQRLLDINDSIKIETYPTALTADNALEVIKEYDLVVDGSDNFTTRYLVNDACVMLGKPLVYGAIYQFDGQNSVFNDQGGPCYRCLFPEQPPAELSPNCSAGGVIGVLPGVIGMIQATETVKTILGLGQNLSGRLMTFDALNMQFSTIAFKKRADCAVCSDNPAITTLETQAQVCNAEPAVELPEHCVITAQVMKSIFDDGQPGDYTILDVRDPEELEICALPKVNNIPVSQLESRLPELDKSQCYYVACYAGGRAKKAVKLLRDKGFDHSFAIDGGMKSWVKDVDPSMPIY